MDRQLRRGNVLHQDCWHVGQHHVNDVKLGTLFMILITATPGTALSIQAQVSSILLELG